MIKDPKRWDSLDKQSLLVELIFMTGVIIGFRELLGGSLSTAGSTRRSTEAACAETERLLHPTAGSRPPIAAQVMFPFRVRQ